MAEPTPAAQARLDQAFAELATHTAAQAPAPDLGQVRTIVTRRRGTTLAAALAVLALAAATPAGYLLRHRDPGTPADTTWSMTPTTTTTPASPSATATEPAPASTEPPNTSPGGIQGVDWANATVTIPANQTGCAAGRARFHNEYAQVGSARYRLGGGYGRAELPIVAYGDVDGDGRLDALLVVSCVTKPRTNPPSVLLFIQGGTGQTLGLAYSGRPREADDEGDTFLMSLEFAPPSRTVVFMVRNFEGMGQCQSQLRWTGSAFTGDCSP